MGALKEMVKTVLPSRAFGFLMRTQRRIASVRATSLPVLTESEFRAILINDLGLKEADTVFIHSSLDQLNLGFEVPRVLPVIQQITGEKGTCLFPTYPRPKSYEFLSRGEVFDVRRTPSYTGLLTEIARRDRNALRSLHPTKSVCAIGQHAKELVSTHQYS